jgi:hypothetical protein
MSVLGTLREEVTVGNLKSGNPARGSIADLATTWGISGDPLLLCHSPAIQAPDALHTQRSLPPGQL